MHEMAMNHTDRLVPCDEGIHQATTRQPENVADNGQPGKYPDGQPVILKAVYYAEPDSSDDAMLAEIARHGGEDAFSSKCLCCNRREIAAMFGDQAKALEAGEVLKANWDAEVEILPFTMTRGARANSPGGS